MPDQNALLRITSIVLAGCLPGLAPAATTEPVGGQQHSADSFLGSDGKYHAKGSFLGQDGKYHPQGSFLGQDDKYHYADSFLGDDGHYRIPASG